MWRRLVVSCAFLAVTAGLQACTVSPTLGWTYMPEATSVWGLSVDNTSDGGVVVGGGHNSAYDMYALKLSASGSLDWDMAYSNLSTEGSHGELWRTPAYGLRQTDDGGYIIAGSGNNDEEPLPDKAYLLVKTNDTGEVVWSRTYAPVNPFVTGQLCIRNIPGALDVTSDGGYFIAGSSYVGGFDMASVLKTDANGEVEFLKIINDNDKDYNQIITDGQQTLDGGYILTGFSDNGSSHGYLALLIKLDAAGNTVFSKTYQYIPEDHGATSYAVAQTMDGEYVIGGILVNDITKVLNHGFWMARLDENGNLLWEQALGSTGGIYYPRTIAETPQGDLVAGGADGTGSMAVSKFSPAGALLWNFSLPAELPKAAANDLTLTADGGCVVVGSGISAGTIVAKINNVFPVEE